MYTDEKGGAAVLVCTVGKTVLLYDARALDDLHAMLKKHGDWMELGSADEQKPAKEGTVEAWGRSSSNPVKGWYGLKKGLRGRFGMYLPPVLEALGLAEVEHNPKKNRVRARGRGKGRDRHSGDAGRGARAVPGAGGRSAARAAPLLRPVDRIRDRGRGHRPGRAGEGVLRAQ